MQNNKPKTLQRILTMTIKIVVVFVIVLAVPLVNYNIDPSRLYHTSRADSLELQAVSYLLNGQNAANLSNCNERLIRREYLRLTDRQIGTVVLGSSRGALITADMLGVDDFFNLSVSGAALEDLIGVYGYARLCGQNPAKVVISIDPWLLNDNFSDPRAWDAFGDGLLYSFSELLDVENDRSYSPSGLYDPDQSGETSLLALSGDLKKNLFSIPYFQTALQHWASGAYVAYSSVVPTDAVEGMTGIMRADGSYSYPAAYRNADEAAISVRAETSLPAAILGLENYDNLDSANRALFEAFVAALIGQGVEVSFLLQPVSPVLYDHMLTEERYESFFAAEAMFRSIAETNGISLYGSFNPHDTGLTAFDFYDGYHVKPAQVAVYVQQLLATEAVQPEKAVA